MTGSIWRTLRCLAPLVAVLALAGTVRGASAGRNDLNVLLITIDTLRYDRVSILSDRYVKTPHLDALARQSAVFTHAYAHDPLTRPSHTNILTGTTPLYHGVSDNPGFKLESRFETLAELLKANGHKTAAFVGAFVLDSRFGLDQGFDLYNADSWTPEHEEFDVVERTADQVVDQAMDWIGHQREKWFSWVHVFDPHDPYTPPEPFRTEYQNDPYSGEVAFVDAQLGRLFDFLRDRGLLEKTVIIVTADHGEAFGEKEEFRHGFFAYNNTLHVPLFLFVPGAAPAMVGENACHIDIFPTVCDLLGLPVPDFVQGESLLPLIAGGKRRKAMIYFESMAPSMNMGGAPLSGFIRGNQKFIDQPVKEVYDLAADPAEDRNLVSSADVAGLTDELKMLKKGLKGKGTTQDWNGKNPEIRPLLISLGYIAPSATKKKTYGPADDLKVLAPLIARLREAINDFKSGRPADAEKKLQTILRIRPIYINAHTVLADIYDLSGQTDEAVAALKDGLEKNPGTLALTWRLGAVLIKARRFAEALEPLKEAVDRDPFNPQTLNYLGMAYLATGDYKQADKNLKKALEFDPDNTQVLNNKGYLSLALYIGSADEKDYEAAIRSFDAALALEPGLPSALKGKEAAAKQKALHTGTIWN